MTWFFARCSIAVLAAFCLAAPLSAALGHDAQRAYEANERPECDALVTNRPGLLLGVLAADCAPIVLWIRTMA